MVQNPIVQIREEMGLSQKVFCQMAGIRPDNLYLTENGLAVKPSRRVLRLLEDAGYDQDEIRSAYQAYRAAMQAEMRERLRSNRANGVGSAQSAV